MKNERLLCTMGQIDDDLIRDAMADQPRKTRRVWVRWVAAAACLCLLLASPVGAAMGESITKFMNNGQLEFILPDRLRLKELTPEALAAFPDVEGQTNYVCKDSLAEAEDYLGIDLPENPVLEEALRAELQWEWPDGRKPDSHCIISLSTGDQPEPYCVDAEFAYWIDDILVHVMYRCPTEKNPYVNGGGVGFETDMYDGSVYTTKEGRVWDLFIMKAEFGGDIGYALSKVDGTLTWVQILGASRLLTRDEIETQLIEIAEAYG